MKRSKPSPGTRRRRRPEKPTADVLIDGTPIDIHGRELDKFFKALSDETRRHILQLLNEGDHTVGELVSSFHLAQPTISRHLAVLKEANLVLDQRQGQHVEYRLIPASMARSAENFFGEFRPGHQKVWEQVQHR